MIEIYKRVEKDLEHVQGVERIEKTDKPFIICLSAQNDLRSVCGIPKVVMRAARVYTDDENAALLRLEDMPIDFLGVRFSKEKIEDVPEEELVDKFLIPYLTSKGSDFESVMREAAKVNFLTYCDGTLTYTKIESVLLERLRDMKFTEDEVSQIVSKITLVATSTDRNTDNLRCTSIKLKDINDTEVLEEREKKCLPDTEEFTFGVTPSNPDSVIYIYRGNGEHSVRALLDEDSLAKPVFCALMFWIIKKATRGETLTSDEILAIMEKYAKDNLTESHSIMEGIDKKVSFDGVRKYDEASVELRRELDRTLKTLASVQSSLENEKLYKRNTQIENQALKKGINELCSEVTRKKILMRIGWQFSGAEIARLDALPSDKDIVDRKVGEEGPKKL